MRQEVFCWVTSCHSRKNPSKKNVWFKGSSSGMNWRVDPQGINDSIDIVSLMDASDKRVGVGFVKRNGLLYRVP